MRARSNAGRRLHQFARQTQNPINPLPLIPPHLSPPLATGVFSASPPAGRAIMTSDRPGETGSSRRRPRRGRIGWRAPESNPAPGSRPRLPGLATALPARARPRAAPGDGRHARVKSRRRSRSCRKPRLAGWDGSPFTPTTGRTSVPPRPRSQGRAGSLFPSPLWGEGQGEGSPAHSGRPAHRTPPLAVENCAERSVSLPPAGRGQG
jgi:hypothetical protein